MPKILIATEKPFAKEAVDGIKNIALKEGFETELLEKYTEKAQLIKAIENVDAVIVRSDKITKEIIDNAKNLKIIVRAGAGFDNIDLNAATQKKIVVMNTPGQNSNAVAELAIGMMIFMSRGNFKGLPGTELKGKKLGIHAYGNVGKIVAKIAKGFGIDVYAFDPFVNDEIILNDNVKPVHTIEELYSTCNFISLHIPSNEKTNNSINFDLLNKMPKGACLVNTARKEVVCENSLQKMFATRPDFKYVTDIMPACNAELIKYETRYYATPKKQGAETAEANINAGLAAANQIVKYIKFGENKFQVNK